MNQQTNDVFPVARAMLFFAALYFVFALLFMQIAAYNPFNGSMQVFCRVSSPFFVFASLFCSVFAWFWQKRGNE